MSTDRVRMVSPSAAGSAFCLMACPDRRREALIGSSEREHLHHAFGGTNDLQLAAKSLDAFVRLKQELETGRVEEADFAQIDHERRRTAGKDTIS
jgi:hypothetical protein